MHGSALSELRCSLDLDRIEGAGNQQLGELVGTIDMPTVSQVARAPPNYAMQWSSRVGTPLAGTGSGADRWRSASGAPTARRR